MLRHTKTLIEYVKLTSTKIKVSNQVNQKKNPNRPPKNNTLITHKLPKLHNTIKTIRKAIKHAIQINNIAPKTKKTAKKARLTNNQSTLKKIANTNKPHNQLKMITQLTKTTNQNLRLNNDTQTLTNKVSKPTTKHKNNQSSKTKATKKITTHKKINALYNNK